MHGLSGFFPRPVALWATAALLLMLAVPSALAADILTRSSGSWLFGPKAVWTDGTTTAIFHPLSEPMSATSLVSVRVTYQLSELSGPCRIRPALRYSNNGFTWDSAVAIDTTNSDYIGSNVIDYGDTYVDITALGGATPRAWVQFGVQAANASAGATGLCNATLKVEPKELVR